MRREAKFNKKIIVLSVFASLCVSAINAQSLTSFNITLGAGANYDRTFEWTGDFLLNTRFHPFNVCNAGAGLLLSQNEFYTEQTLFASLGASLSVIPWRPMRYFSADALYIYDTISDYETSSHSLVPLVAFTSTYFDAALGYSWLWTRFFDTDTILETKCALSLTARTLVLNKLSAGISIANFDEYYNPPNFWAMRLKFFADYRFNTHTTLNTGITLLQTGLDGFTTRFYGIQIRSALTLSW
jgi:hypothetical protein